MGKKILVPCLDVIMIGFFAEKYTVKDLFLGINILRMNHKDRTYCAVLGYFYGILQTSSIFFGLPMIAAVIAEKTCDTPTCSLVEVFMINETFPVGQLYPRATFIKGIHHCP